MATVLVSFELVPSNMLWQFMVLGRSTRCFAIPLIFVTPVTGFQNPGIIDLDPCEDGVAMPYEPQLHADKQSKRMAACDRNNFNRRLSFVPTISDLFPHW